ncbi:hypothetical protein [Chromobacterium vaccinii]|uniref:hypothetical protein n=1 Tax=Chromobacterium vaccinii TaxID=1108595 RepID=UPI000E1385DD|nr:hypothetical protein [Chromobacterium vaccinii]SUX53999.1 Uncharacterised protein [Chromobacterium vaccinii]
MASNARTRFILLAVPCYALFALAWIFFSDQLLAGLDISRVVSLSIAKGIFFVLVTSVLLLLALRAVPSGDNGMQLFWLGSLANGVRSERWTNWLAYPVVLALLGGALALRQFLMGPDLSDHPMLILFMLPIILGACMGDLALACWPPCWRCWPST